MRSFLAANLTQNYFLIARMLRIFVTFATKVAYFENENVTNFDVGNGERERKWRENEEMEKEGGYGENEEM